MGKRFRLGKSGRFKGLDEKGLRDHGSTPRSSHPVVYLGKGVLKICSKFTGEHPC